jgi:TonB-linked SusC/RagA family outer membrane protein
MSRTLPMVVVLATWLPAGEAVAQSNGTITGLVTGANGLPLRAAQVFVPGTGIGALTNDAGRYLLLEVPPGEHRLTVQLVGHHNASRLAILPPGGTVVVDFALTPAPIFLDEVVVTGTGRASRRRQLGNTLATIDASRVANSPISSFSELLQAREPSVTALTSDGATASGARIRIRGSNSISMSNEPVVYVDGIRVDNSGDMEGTGNAGDTGSRLDDINWGAVDRVEILKGAAAATLYGSEASSGVIQIFTKAGRPGETRVTAKAEYGALVTPDRIPAAAGFARDAGQAEALSALYGQTIAPFEVFERDFTKDLLESGRTYTLVGDVSGGSDDVQYFVGGRYGFEDGVLGGQSLGNARDQLRRLQANASMTLVPARGVSIRVTTGYTQTDLETFTHNNNTVSPTSGAMTSRPERATCSRSSVDPTRTFGDATPVCTGQGNPTGSPFGLTIREAMQRAESVQTRHFIGSIATAWSGGPGLSARALVGLDQVDEESDFSWPYGWNVDGSAGSFAPAAGRRDLAQRDHREVTVDVQTAWRAELGGDWVSELTAGAQRFSLGSDFVRLAGIGFPAPGIDVIQVAETQLPETSSTSKISLGGYLQEQVGYRDWLFATLGARFDRTSAFGVDAGSALYPKVGISALLSDLSSWTTDAVPTLRIRAAYGQSGLQPGAFDRATTYLPIQTAEGVGLQPGNLGNPDLAPERSSELELGVDAEFLGRRLGVDLTYWDRTTNEALVSRRVPAASGFTEAQLGNIGRLEAHGWEIRLVGAAVQGSGITLNLIANAAYLSEVVTRTGVPTIDVTPGYPRHRNVIQEGLPPGAFVGARLIPTCSAGTSGPCYTPGTTVPYDIDGDGLPDSLSEFQAYLTAAERSLSDLSPMLADEDGDGDLYDHYLGKPTPDWQGSFGADLTLGRRVSVSTLFEYRAGAYAVSNLTRAFRNNLIRNSREVAEIESTLLDPSTRDEPRRRLDAAMTWATELRSLSPYSGLNLIESGNFVRWRELSLTYRVDESLSGRLGVDDLTVSVTGRNLWVWTGYSGVDPESNQMGRCGGGGEAGNAVQCNFLEANEVFGLPLPRRLSISFRATF